MAESHSLEQRWDPLPPTAVIRVTSLLGIELGHVRLTQSGLEGNPFAGVCDDCSLNNAYYLCLILHSMHFKVITCDRLQDIRNGKVVLSGTSVGSTASYSCNVGYVLVGGSTRVCQLNGEWTGEEPSCKCILLVSTRHDILTTDDIYNLHLCSG